MKNIKEQFVTYEISSKLKELNMKEELITFETAKLAKEKGFNLEFKNYYSKDGVLYESDNRFNLDWNDKNVSSEELTWDDDFPETHICYTAPTQAHLQKWLREEHKIVVLVDVYPNPYSYQEFQYSVRNNILPNGLTTDLYETYEEALEVGLQEGLALININ